MPPIRSAVVPLRARGPAPAAAVAPAGATTVTSTAPATGAVLVTGSEELVEEVAALAAAAGVAVAVVPDAGTALGTGFGTAPGAAVAGAALVMLGEDALVAGLAPHRGTVVVLRRAAPGAPDDEGAGDEGMWRAAVAVGARAVLVLPAERRALLDLLGAQGGDPAASAPTVAVLGACGGLGASSLAAALALSAGRSTSALLVDGDPLGGGIDLLLGLEDAPGLRWGDVAGARGSVRPAVLAQNLPRLGSTAVLSCSRGAPAAGGLDPDAVAVVLDAGRRGHGCVVLDVARHLDEAARAALAAAGTLLVVTSTGVRGAAAAQAVLAATAPLVGDVRLVVRAPAGRARTDPLALADALGVPLGAVLAHDPSLVEAAERGQPPPVRGRGATARACADLADVLVAS